MPIKKSEKPGGGMCEENSFIHEDSIAELTLWCFQDNLLYYGNWNSMYINLLRASYKNIYIFSCFWIKLYIFSWCYCLLHTFCLLLGTNYQFWIILSSENVGTLHLPVQADFQYCVKMPRNDLSVCVCDESPVHVAQWFVECIFEELFLYGPVHLDISNNNHLVCWASHKSRGMKLKGFL